MIDEFGNVMGIGMYSAAAARGGEACAEALRTVLCEMGLPEPQHGEYLEGNESELLFLDDAGIVIRAGYKMNAPEHFCILAPLRGSEPLQTDPDLRANVIEILPGIRCSLFDFHDRDNLVLGLRRDGIDFWDTQRDNCGYLPMRSALHPNGVPVVLDRGAVRWTGALSGEFNSNAAATPQAEIYAALREPLIEAWPPGAQLPVKSLAPFLNACREDVLKGEKNGGLLCARWLFADPARDAANNNAYGKPSRAAQAGAAYARRVGAKRLGGLTR